MQDAFGEQLLAQGLEGVGLPRGQWYRVRFRNRHGERLERRKLDSDGQVAMRCTWSNLVLDHQIRVSSQLLKLNEIQKSSHGTDSEHLKLGS